VKENTISRFVTNVTTGNMQYNAYIVADTGILVELVIDTICPLLLQSSSMVMQSGEPGGGKTEGLDVEETVRGDPSPPTLDLLA